MNPSPREAGPRRRSARSLRRSAVLASACLLAFVAGAARAGSPDPSFAPGPPIPAGRGPVAAAVADFNGHGKPDVAVANAGSNDVTILLGDGVGGVAAAARSPVKASEQPVSVATPDFNGDGKADLAVANRGSKDVTVLLGDGAGGFGAAPGINYTTPELVGRDLVVVLDATAQTGSEFKWEYVVLRLGPTGPRARFSLARAVWGDSLLADLRLGPDGKLYQLATSPTTEVAISRYSLGPSSAKQWHEQGRHS